MENIRKETLEMHTLLLCADVQFLGTMRIVLNQLQGTPKIVSGCDAAVAMIQEHEFDDIIVDWREIDNLGDFLCAVRKSKLNQECVSGRDHAGPARPAPGFRGGSSLPDLQTRIGRSNRALPARGIVPRLRGAASSTANRSTL